MQALELDDLSYLNLREFVGLISRSNVFFGPVPDFAIIGKMMEAVSIVRRPKKKKMHRVIDSLPERPATKNGKKGIRPEYALAPTRLLALVP